MPSFRLLIIAGLGLLCGACASVETTGLRGVGTVFREPRPLVAAESHPIPVAVAAPTPPAVSPSLPLPDVAERLPLSPPTTDAQQHVIPVPLGPAPSPNPLPARRLIIPSIGLNSKVIPIGTTYDRRGQLAWETAAFAVGHHRSTAGPGQAGNMVLSGHISSPAEGAVFRRLPDIEVGDGVVVQTEERQYLYRVVSHQVVEPTDVSVMQATELATVTLITCIPDGIYSHRLVVTAQLL